MRIHLGGDHAGFAMKQVIGDYMRELGHDVTDVGPFDDQPVDYPDFALKVARAVRDGEAERGVLVCGTGIGMAIAANKVRGVRAAMITAPELAEMARRHNDLNVLTIGGRYTDSATAKRIVDMFLTTEFEAGRHERRIDKIKHMEDPAHRE